MVGCLLSQLKHSGFSILSCENGVGLRPRIFFTANNGEFSGFIRYVTTMLKKVAYPGKTNSNPRPTPFDLPLRHPRHILLHTMTSAQSCQADHKVFTQHCNSLVKMQIPKKKQSMSVVSSTSILK